jgi:hypothetical protein
MMIYIPNWLSGLTVAVIGAIAFIIGIHLFMSDDVIDYAHKIRNGLILMMVGIIIIMVGFLMLPIK